jgi:hypothetical protein
MVEAFMAVDLRFFVYNISLPHMRIAWKLIKFSRSNAAGIWKGMTAFNISLVNTKSIAAI